nr:multidrug efflux SMR transporter [Luteimicrobium album]
MSSTGSGLAWAVLIVSGGFEAGWALCLKASYGFSRLWPSVGFVVLLAASMVGLSYALRSLPVGVAYGVWVGVGATATALLAIPLFGETVTMLKIVSLALVVAGIVGLNLAGEDTHDPSRPRQASGPRATR